MGEPALAPQTAVTVSCFKPEIYSTEWLVVTASHSLEDAGLTTRVEMEIGESGTAAREPTPD